MSITIKDVAKEAGVSVATVSRVLNGSCNVSDESTKKVNETIARLNYSPNFLGRNLRKCETNVILVIMPTSEHSLYSKIVMGMQDYAGQVGYDIITAVSYSTSTAETSFLTERLTVLSFLALSMTQIHLISSQRIITLLCVVRAWRAQMCLLSLLTMNRLRLTLSLLLSKRVIKG